MQSGRLGHFQSAIQLVSVKGGRWLPSDFLEQAGNAMKLLMLLVNSIDPIEADATAFVGQVSFNSWLLSVRPSARGAYLGESPGRRFWCRDD